MHDLSDEQLRIIDHPAGSHALVLAVAGCGKTTTMAHRLRRLMVDRKVPASAIRVVMFNNLAQKQFAARAKALGVPEDGQARITTFHALAYRELRAADLVPPLPELWTDDRSELSLNTVRRALWAVAKRPDCADVAHCREREALSAVNLWKGELTPPERAGHHVRPLLPLVYAEYERLRAKAGGVTFDDFIPMLLGNETAAARLRKRSRELRYLIVDEYQDVNLGQQRLIETLLGPDTELMVVGDDDQTINEWRGARSDFIRQRFHETFCDRPITTYQLSRTFRFGPRLALAADAVIANNTERHAKVLLANDPARDTRVDLLINHSEQGSSVDGEIAARIAQLREQYLQQGVTDLQHRLAVLGRFFHQLCGVEAECLRRGIPYHVLGKKPFLERHEVQQVLAYLRLALVRTEPLTERSAKLFAGVLNVPNRKLPRADVRLALDHGLATRATLADVLARLVSPLHSPLTGSQREVLQQLADRLERLQELMALPELQAKELLEWLLDHVPFREHFQHYFGEDEESEERQHTLDALLKYAGELRMSADAFLTHVDGLDPTCGVPPEQQVLFTSIFRTKGVEYDHVFIPNCVETVMPSHRAVGIPTFDTAPTLPPPPETPPFEVERRLFYVGITRAVQSLTIGTTQPPQRGQQQQTTSLAPSRFLAEMALPDVERMLTLLQATGRGAATSAVDRALSDLRQERGREPTMDRMLESLDHWYLPELRRRSAAARSQAFDAADPPPALGGLRMAGVPWRSWQMPNMQWCLPQHRDRLRGALLGMVAGEVAVRGARSELIPALCRVADSVLQWKPEASNDEWSDCMPATMDRVEGGADGRALVAAHGPLLLLPLVLMDGLRASWALPNLASAMRYVSLPESQQRSMTQLASVLCAALAGRPVESLFEQPVDALREWPRPMPTVAGMEMFARVVGAADPAAINGDDALQDSLQRAVWALAQAVDFSEGLTAALDAGGDRAMVAALYGTLAGGLFGESVLSTDRLASVPERLNIERLAEELYLAACSEVSIRKYCTSGRRSSARIDSVARLRELAQQREPEVDPAAIVEDYLLEADRLASDGGGWGSMGFTAVAQESLRQARVTSYMFLAGVGWPEVPEV